MVFVEIDAQKFSWFPTLKPVYAVGSCRARFEIQISDYGAVNEFAGSFWWRCDWSQLGRQIIGNCGVPSWLVLVTTPLDFEVVVSIPDSHPMRFAVAAFGHARLGVSQP